MEEAESQGSTESKKKKKGADGLEQDVTVPPSDWLHEARLFDRAIMGTMVRYCA